MHASFVRPDMRHFVANTLAALMYLILAETVDRHNAHGMWVMVAATLGYQFHYLMTRYRESGPAILTLLLLLTYYVAPIPFFAFDISIVPYIENSDAVSYLRTWAVMAIFLSGMCVFTALAGGVLKGAAESVYVTGAGGRFGNVSVVYWAAAMIFMLLFFSGESILNVSGDDNYDVYIQNLKGQSGSLEYFLAAFVVGYGITPLRKSFPTVLMACVLAYFSFFCFTRGYRVQLMQMIFLVGILRFRHFMSVRNVLLASVLGFLFLQAHGLMKHGTQELASLFSLMAGDQVRTNQTEVFYTSNNVVNPIYMGMVPWAERAYSFLVALVALVVPGGFLPDSWHTTLSSAGLTGLPGGGGGFIAGHYFYWLSYPGLFLGAFFVVVIFRLNFATKSPYLFLLTSLLLATSPRWIAYEPVANFFRMGMYFSVLYLLVSSVLKSLGNSRSGVAS